MPSHMEIATSQMTSHSVSSATCETISVPVSFNPHARKRYLPASVSIPGVEACRYIGFGGVMRASRGEAICCGVPIALCIGRAPFAM